MSVVPDSIKDLPIPIVRTKLYPPPLSSDNMPRRLLVTQAQSVMESPLTLVSAPAGYGKSTLVRQWLEQLECKSAWLSLDSADRDLTQFLSYLVAAVRGTYPDSFAEITGILNSATPPSIDHLAGFFCNELETLAQPIVLVLDDYHQVSPSEIDNFFDAVLKHPPQNLHLILVTRLDPSLAIPALRARGVLYEIRMRELRFSPDETRDFIQANLGDAITNDEIEILHQRTEGWPAALRLAKLAAGEQEPTKGLVDHLPDNNYAIRAYLMQEVLARQSADIRAYLLRAAFLDRFCMDLCDAVTPELPSGFSGRDFIDYIRQANLFSIALDTSEEWFRFHHLFQAMLQDQALTELGSEAIGELQTRASLWFEEHEFIADAIRHALNADKGDEAASVIIRHRNKIMNNEWWHQLDIWLHWLPPNIIASRPELQLMKARVFRTKGQNAELVQALDAAELLLDTAGNEDVATSELYGSLASMRCYQFYEQSDGEAAVRISRQALELLPPDDMAERGFAMIILSVALQMTGDAKGAKENVYSAIAEASGRFEDKPTYMTRLLAALCYVYWIDADLKELDLVATNTEKLSKSSDLWEALSVGVHFKAASHYQQNRLLIVEDDLKDLLRKKSITTPELYAHSLIVLGLTKEVLGSHDAALKCLESLRDLAFRSQNPYLIELSEAFTAELAVREGNMTDALKWARQYDPEPFKPIHSFFSPALCLLKILVLDDGATSRKRALELSPKLEDYLTSIHNKQLLISTLALRALLTYKTGDTALASEQLGNAVSLAQPGGFIRRFVDVGPKLVPVLNLLELKDEKLQYVGRILAAFASEGDESGAIRTDPKAGMTFKDVAGLPESLSQRESEVLRLLAERLTNKEISEQLFISTATVKRHAHNIYEKLNVKGRHEAVTKAVGLGLIAA